MAFKEKAVDKGARDWFVPALIFDGEKNQASADPFAVEISPLTAGEEDEIAVAVADVTALAFNHVARAKETKRRVFCRHVHAVRGWYLADGSVPKDGAALLESLDRSEPAVKDVVFAAILSAIYDGGTLKAGLLDTLRPH